MNNDTNDKSPVPTGFIAEVREIVEHGRQLAYTAVNGAMTSTYWQIGRRIVEEEQRGKERAEYGKALIAALSAELTRDYGSGFSKRYLAYFRKFYLTVPDGTILQTRLQNVSWSHILTTLRVDDATARRRYLETASEQSWSVRTLSRNISTQYYERHFIRPGLPSESNGGVPKKERRRY